MNDKITTDIISTTGINITKYDILPAKVFINGVEVTDTESWNKAISTFSELQDKINNLQSKIDKANEIINKLCIYGYGQVNCRPIKNTTKQEVYNAMYEIKNVLKEVENVENN